MNTGSSLRNPAEIVPRRASLALRAASTRCTMYWSVHQYHTPRIGAPNTMPVQGKFGWFMGFQIWKKSAGTRAASPPQPPTAPSPSAVSRAEPPISTTVCITSV